jgi:hypothetical protein
LFFDQIDLIQAPDLSTLHNGVVGDAPRFNHARYEISLGESGNCGGKKRIVSGVGAVDDGHVIRGIKVIEQVAAGSHGRVPHVRMKINRSIHVNEHPLPLEQLHG